MDITKTTEPKSDQINYDDVATRTVTVTVTEVKAGSKEQPVDVHLVEFPGRPFRPSKSMRRVLIAAWGPEASNYVGRRMILYGDPTVKFGGIEVGGIRISHLSDIPEALSVGLTVTRGKRAPFIVQPLDGDVSGRDWLAELAVTGDDKEAVAALGTAAKNLHATAGVLAAIRVQYKRVAALPKVVDPAVPIVGEPV